SGARPPNEIERIVALGIRAFPPQIRDEIAARGRDQRQAIRGQLRQVEQARREMFAAMRAEPFDPAALERSYEALRMATAELQRAGQQIVSGVLADAPPEVRRNIRHRRGPRPR
ncbi:MAG: periplasmic heavy metal sensor, partial [Alphaproteobacteria bacterium]